MAEEVIATFSGPLNSFSINLTLENASKHDIREFGISGRTAKFPVTWQFMGVTSGPATVTSTTGLDTEVLMLGFANFAPGAKLKLSGIDPDFTGDSSSGVRVLDMAGARVCALFSDGTTAFGEFEATDDGLLQASIPKGH
jgi:hypothetical protein